MKANCQTQATGLQVFYNEDANVNIRMEQVDGEPWFVAKDVCAALNISAHRDAIARLEDDERGSVVVDTLGGAQSLGAVNESGLYNLIFQSRKPEARAFRRWVTNEVLPAIRRTGAYKLSDEARDRKKLPLPKYRPFYAEWQKRVEPYISIHELAIVSVEYNVTFSHVAKVYRGTTVSERITRAITTQAMNSRNEGYFYPDAVPVHEQLVIEWDNNN